MSFELIETVTLDTAAASIEFTSIPQDGTDLVLKLSSRNVASVTNLGGTVRINGVSTSGFYSYIRLLGTGSAVNTASSSTTSGVQLQLQGGDTTANTFDNQQIYISNYTSSEVKSFSVDGAVENNATAAALTLYAGTSSGDSGSTTAAVTSLEIGAAENFVAGSTASLYKITAA